MVGPVDVHNFSTFRANSPPQHHGCHAPVRANQSSKLEAHVPRSFDLGALRRYPPPPSVEDEAASLAKEHGLSAPPAASSGEEPQCRGDLEQHPIILPVPEHNHERRFVLLTSPDSDDEGWRDPPTPTTPRRSEYEANTCRKFTMARADDGTAVPTGLGRRRSRADLPQIQTDIDPAPARPGIHRARSTANLDQRYHEARDRGESTHSQQHYDRYREINPPEHRPRPSADGLLSPLTSPSFIKHATKGRDRAYFDFNHGGNKSESRSHYGEESASTTRARRSISRPEMPPAAAAASRLARPEAPKRAGSAADAPKPSRRPSEKHAVRDELSSSPHAKKASTSTSPPKEERKSSAAHRRTSSASKERERLSRRRSTHRLRRDSDGHASDDEAKTGRHLRRRKSTVGQDERPVLLGQDAAVRPRVEGRSKSRVRTPLPSPRIFQCPPQPAEDERMLAAASSQTGDGRRHDDRPVSPFSSGSSSPRNQSRAREDGSGAGARPMSRPASVVLGVGAGAGLPALASPFLTSPPPSPDGRRKSWIPPRPASRQNSLDSSPLQPQWVPQLASPQASDHVPNGPAAAPGWSYRQLVEDVVQGAATPLCPRETPRAGYNDWLTLPRRDNFNVCPDCYAAVFDDTEFRTQLVPAPFRPKDKKVACVFGSSPWFRIAWLLTQRRQLADLRLLRAVADGLDDHRPCPRDRRASRTWQSILDPFTRKMIPDFEVCAGCVRAVEALFPGLQDVFQPVDPPGEAHKGLCALRFAPDRKRFLDYLDVLGSESERALSAAVPAGRPAPDVGALAGRISRMASVEECSRDLVVDNRNWFFMRDIPSLTVCEECFGEVVLPELERSPAVAGNFYRRPQRLARAACHLYSPRTRDIFRTACSRIDLGYLEDKMLERRKIEKDIHEKLIKYEDGKASEVNAREVKRLVREWKMWE